MRTTIDIDDDVLQAAKALARAERKTAGQVISELVRKALTTPSRDSQPGLAEDGVPFTGLWQTLPGRTGVLVTPELIEQVQDEIDREDCEIHDGRPPSASTGGATR